MRSRAGARLCRLSIRTSSSPEPTRQSPEAARKGLPALQERIRERCSVRDLAEHRIHAALPLAVEQRQLALGRGFAGPGHGAQGLEKDTLVGADVVVARSEEHQAEHQSLMRKSYAVFCLNKKKNHH